MWLRCGRRNSRSKLDIPGTRENGWRREKLAGKRKWPWKQGDDWVAMKVRRLGWGERSLNGGKRKIEYDGGNAAKGTGRGVGVD